MTQIEQIHKEFDFDFMELIRDSNESSMIERHCPSGVDVNAFGANIIHWRTFYPGQNFIPFSKVTDICTKYGLAFGPLWAFIDRIPDRNTQNIRSFRLREQDDKFTATPVDVKLNSPVVNLASAWIPGDVAAGPVVFYPIFNNLGVLQHNGRHTVISSHKLGGNTVDIMWDDPDVISWVESKSVPGGFSCRGRIKANRKVFSLPQPRKLSTHVVPMVVAPVKWFSMIGLEVSKNMLKSSGGGSELKPSVPNPMRFASFMANGFGMRDEIASKLLQEKIRDENRRVELLRAAEQKALADIDDPVILHPVSTGGFLEITKWGPEAMIPEFQNPTTN